MVGGRGIKIEIKIKIEINSNSALAEIKEVLGEYKCINIKVSHIYGNLDVSNQSDC